jgi:hypothetical protein
MWATRIAMIALLAEGPVWMDKVPTLPSTKPTVAKQIHNFNGAMLSIARSFP